VTTTGSVQLRHSGAPSLVRGLAATAAATGVIFGLEVMATEAAARFAGTATHRASSLLCVVLSAATALLVGGIATRAQLKTHKSQRLASQAKQEEKELA